MVIVSVQILTNAQTAEPQADIESILLLEMLNSIPVNAKNNLENNITTIAATDLLASEFYLFKNNIIQSDGTSSIVKVSTESDDNTIYIYPLRIEDNNKTHTIFMYKFVNGIGTLVTNKTDYIVRITGTDNFTLTHNGSTSTGLDMDFVRKDEIRSANPSVNKMDYNVAFNITRWNGDASKEYVIKSTRISQLG
jgi:hypothetical protein